jgi:hypothetical protein
MNSGRFTVNLTLMSGVETINTISESPTFSTMFISTEGLDLDHLI